MFHTNSAAGACRRVLAGRRTPGDLGHHQHSATLHKILSYPNGLILVTGPVGSSQTTTLASMRPAPTTSSPSRTPFEIVQHPRGCNATPREVGPHTRSFAAALTGALREDRDVIVIGELRDLETLDRTLSASETGHLVIAPCTPATPLRPSTASSTSSRPPRNADPQQRGREPARRRLATPPPRQRRHPRPRLRNLGQRHRVQNFIREGKTTGLRNPMETGVREDMCLMEHVVFGLSKNKKITADPTG